MNCLSTFSAESGAVAMGCHTKPPPARQPFFVSQLLDPDDERWYAFGLDKPADSGSPETPANVVLTPGAAGSKILMVHFDDGRNDDSYRVTATNKATGTEITNVIVTEAETTFTFAALAAGTLVDITVTGRNAKGESQSTDPVTAAVP